ncbi:helix-turn-helix domain-containing protein [Rhodococcus pyridinivorans]|uniref:helix-turn-helix transcriptional regulator n=1 Tax=Rhodococcus pyridinivorans TaxID=103816 RepID=UPI001E3B16A7|nr:helix-turn-helix domain-containing protein [Rhodococcus pyridinivorans]MCD5419301.1 helix-turn-helix domain-containing protein [Rhodococcus pyridinivorans]
MRDSGALATADEVAAYLRTSKQQLATWRYKGSGPRFCKVGRRVMYRWTHVDDWLNANTKTRTDDVA